MVTAGVYIDTKPRELLILRVLKALIFLVLR